MAKIDEAINNLTPDELSLLNSDPQLMADFHNKYGAEKTSLLGKAWAALKVPEQMSKQGLDMIAGAVPNPEPTGNMALDLAKGTPKIVAETLAEAAPGFVSPGAILTAGTLKGAKAIAPVVRAGLGQVAKGAEAVSGLEYKTPGILTEIAKNPSILTGPGRAKVGELFQKFMGDSTQIRPSFARATSAKDLLDEAMKAADNESLTPQEALIARQTLDGIKKTIPAYSYRQMRDTLDAIAKTISKEADAAYQTAVKSEAARNILPQNKLGGTSIAKSGLGYLTKGMALPIMSPLVQSSVAALLGLGSKAAAPLANNAVNAGSGVGALLDFLNKNPNLGRR